MLYSTWDQELDTSQTNEVLLHLARWHASQAVSHPQCHEVQRLIDAHDFKALCLFELSHLDCTVDAYRHLRQVTALFSKRDDLDIGVDKRAVAWGKFLEAEQLCLQTNHIFRLYERGLYSFRPCVEAVLYTAAQNISRILGECPSLADLQLRFGPGATTQVKKKDASPRRKLSKMFSGSDELRGVLIPLLEQVPDWSGMIPDRPELQAPFAVSHGKVAFVTKTAKEHRTIGTEPTLNTMLQSGIGLEIRLGLKLRGGVDITDQSKNQELARVGSLHGRLATVDLRNASGTIATGFVRSMVPEPWFDLMQSARTATVRTPDGTMRLNQFSSMGNGFTFPLETLLFYSLVRACCGNEATVSVYGDDIICPVENIPLVFEVLQACGFLVNTSKSFWSGPFRESCGKDFLFGSDVRPLYVKRTLSAADAFVLHNGYVRRGMVEPARILRGFVSDELALYGPDGFGDGHLLGDYSFSRPKREDGWCGVTFETYTRKARTALYTLGADYVYPTYSIYTRTANEDFGGVLNAPSVRGLFRRFRKHAQQSGVFRPDLEQSVYKKDRNGRLHLQDVLPGFEGYTRRKIYALIST